LRQALAANFFFVAACSVPDSIQTTFSRVSITQSNDFP
jgi:hypothetical protein